MPEVIACHLVSGDADYFLEVVVPDLEYYRSFLVGKLLNLPIVREVRSDVAIEREGPELLCHSATWRDMRDFDATMALHDRGGRTRDHARPSARHVREAAE